MYMKYLSPYKCKTSFLTENNATIEYKITININKSPWEYQLTVCSIITFTLIIMLHIILQYCTNYYYRDWNNTKLYIHASQYTTWGRYGRNNNTIHHTTNPVMCKRFKFLVINSMCFVLLVPHHCAVINVLFTV